MLGGYHSLSQPILLQVAASSSAIERGRLIYFSKGCTGCHSDHRDTPAQHAPDLRQVGARRSALWLKMHLFDPKEVSGSSGMPSYAFLFRTRKGDDLVAFLSSLGASATTRRIANEQQWHLPQDVLDNDNPAAGEKLYNEYCATCHSADGRTRLRWQSDLTESPAVLRAEALHSSHLPQRESARVEHLAQIIKFGIPNSDMAGHERLSDKDVASLSLWLAQMRLTR